MKPQQCFTNGIRNKAAHRTFVTKFNLPFRWMNIHIHRRRIDFKEQAAYRKAALHEGGVITLEQGVIDAAIFHRTPIDEKMLFVSCGP